MKKILSLSILPSFIFGLLFASHVFAATPTISATATGQAVKVTLSGVTEQNITGVTITVEPSIGSKPGVENTPETVTTTPANGTLSFNISQFLTTTPIYVKATINYQKNSSDAYATLIPASDSTNEVAVTPAAITINITPLQTSLSGNNIIISGKIDPAQNPWFTGTNFTATLQYSTTTPATGATTLTAGLLGPLTSEQKAGTLCTSGPCINTDGTYYWQINNVNPSTTYYLQQTISVYNTSSQKVDTIDQVNSSTGTIVLPTAASQQSYNEQHGYTLLSQGFPGLSFLPDPDLCAQERAAAAAGGTAAPQFCDINDVLNYFLKLLIGITGVFLVFRLMYEGFAYMTTDIPFIKASSKGAFMTSLGGLLLVMTSYIILNTINPKLVNETVSVQQLSIGIPETSLDSQTFQNITGEKIETESAYLPMVQTIAQQQGVDACVVEATIQIESNWNAAAIGCDEDQPYSSVPSRKAFLQSGITYSGTTFTPTTDTSSTQLNNACKFNASQPGYGLDWRFSKGGGLMQVTIFPPDYKTSGWYASVSKGGKDWNNRTTPYAGWQTIIKPETNIAKGTQILKQDLSDCSGNVEAAFREYEGGSCTSSGKLIDATVAKKMSVYNSCKGIS